ncbi:MAG: SPOR domain-containing protein [Candidatus Omnitrophica bacterium]|nr:SPOR domain-containing protein [Candidatus Omnitrophota bacterium]
MGIFGNKNKSNSKSKESLHTLTEQEIQDKLYGHLRVHRQVVQDEMPVLKSSPAPVRMEEETRQIRDKKKEEERLSRISEWADEEAETVSRVSKYSSSQNLGKSFSKPAATSQTKPAPQNIALSALKIVAVILSGILRIFSAPVFRSKKFIYGASAFLFLFLVFLGIHSLNVQREIAMMMPHKPAPPAPAAQQAQPETISPAQPSGPAAVRETKISGTPAAGEATAAKAVAPERLAAQEAPYVVQVATFAVESDAENLVTTFETENLPSFAKSLRRSGGKIYYSVFLGRYKNYQEAQKGLDLFRKKAIAKSFQDAFIRTLS